MLARHGDRHGAGWVLAKHGDSHGGRVVADQTWRQPVAVGGCWLNKHGDKPMAVGGCWPTMETIIAVCACRHSMGTGMAVGGYWPGMETVVVVGGC